MSADMTLAPLRVSALAVLVMACADAGASSQQGADILITGGTVITMD